MTDKDDLTGGDSLGTPLGARPAQPAGASTEASTKAPLDKDSLAILKERYSALGPVLERLGGGESSLLPALDEAERIYGYLPPDSLDLIADALSVGRGHAQWVATVLVPFRFEPGPAHRVRVCRGESCRANGSKGIEEDIRRAVTEADPSGEKISFEPVTCMGACLSGPNVMIDGRMHNHVDPKIAGSLIPDVSDAPDPPPE